MRSVVLWGAVAALCAPVWAADTKEADPQEVIQKFAAKEAEFARARENYTYRQTVKIQELDESGAVRGKYEIISDIIFSPDGKRLIFDGSSSRGAA